MIVNDTAVITCFFNFHNYSVPKRNLRRWQRHMVSLGIPVFGVELLLYGQTGVSEGWEGWRQIRVLEGLHMMWQKEPALNVCVKHLPPQYTKVVVCDSDIWFANPEWLAQTSAVLNVVNACSPYHTAHWTNHEGGIDLSRSSIGADPEGLIPLWRSHPGFAIALTRDFWDEEGPNGIYPFYVVGNGDTALGTALCNLDPTKICVKMFRVGNIMESYMLWHARVRKWNTGFTYVAGDLYHEYHGKLADRKYYERLQWIQSLDPAVHLKFNDDGLLEWTEDAPKTMVEQVAAYFSVRKEDD